MSVVPNSRDTGSARRSGLWMRCVLWAAGVLLLAPLAFGVVSTAPDESLELPEVVVRGIDEVRLDAQRAGVLPLEPPRTAQTAVRVELPAEHLQTPVLRPAPRVQSPGCAYRNPVVGAMMRAGGDPEALYKSALDRLSRDELDQAAYFLAKLRETHPGHPRADDAAFHLAEIRRRRGEVEEAIAFYRLVEGRYTQQARYRLGWFLENRGRSADARTVWTRLAEDPKSPFRGEALYRLGVDRLQARDYPGAVAALERAAEVPDQPEEVTSNALYALGLARRNLGDLDAAERVLVGFLLAHPDHPSAPAAQVALGWTLLEQQKPREARRRFSWVLERNPSPDLEVRARYGLVRAAADVGDLGAADSALASLEAAIPSGPWIGWARADLAWMAFRRADFAAALERYRSALRAWQGKDIGIPQYMVAESLYLLGRYDQADRAYRNVEPGSPLRPTALHRAGLSKLLDGDPAGAERLFSDLLEDHPGYPEVDRVRVWLGEALARQGRPHEALRTYRSVGRESDAYPQAVHGRAWLAFDAERWEEAAELFTRYLKLAPDGPNRDEALLTLARAHFNRRRSRAAMEALDRLEALTADPAYRSAARFHRAWMLTRSGREDTGRAILADLLREEPGGPYAARAHSALGWLDYGEGEYESALAHFEQVPSLSRDPELTAEAQEKRADALFNLQRFEAALEAYRELGDTPEARYGAALSLQRLGREEELQEAAERFASRYPADPRAVDLYLALGRLLSEKDESQGAARAFLRAAALAEDERRSAEARLEAARSLVEGGDREAGLRLLAELGEAAGPVGEAALRERAVVLERAGDPKAAGAAWVEFARRTEGETRAGALAEAARWARLADDWAGARQLLLEALEAAPPDARPVRQRLLADLGETLLLAGEPEEAVPVLQEAAEMGRSPQGMRALGILGRAHEAMSRPADAVDTYLRLGYLYPVREVEVAQALLRAAVLMEEEPGGTERARKLLRKLSEEAPPEWAARAERRLQAGAAVQDGTPEPP